MDTNAIYMYDGDFGEVGSVVRWKGDPEKVGEGKVEITKLIPNEKISYKHTFIDMEAVSVGAFTLNKISDSLTEVSWTNEGSIPFLVRPLALLFFSMDEMMGPDFEKGLNKLDSLTQSIKS